MKKLILGLLVLLLGSILTLSGCSGDGGGGPSGNNASAAIDSNSGGTNSIAVADAGPDQNVVTGSTVTLDGSGSTDADNDPLTYAWSFASKPTDSTAVLSSVTTAKPTFVPDVDGEYVVSLVVNDGTVDSPPATVTVTATTANAVPVADAGPDQNVATGSTVTLDGSGSSDANDDLLTYKWDIVSAPSNSTASLSSVTAIKPTFVADVDGDYVVRLMVNDGTADSQPATVTITAATANSAPVADAGSDRNVVTGSTVTLDGSGSTDADGDALTFAWSFVSMPTDSTAVLSSATSVSPTFVAGVDGDYVIKLVVNDGTVDSQPVTVTMSAATKAWDLSDFSKTTNPNGAWSYGWEQTLNGPLHLYDTMWDTETSSGWYAQDHTADFTPSIWVNADRNSVRGVDPGQVSLHPGWDGSFTVARWTAQMAGTVSVSGSFGAGDVGWMSYYISVNGQVARQWLTDQETESFSLTETVAVGDTIDFIVGVPLSGNYSFGDTPVEAEITFIGSTPAPTDSGNP